VGFGLEPRDYEVRERIVGGAEEPQVGFDLFELLGDVLKAGIGAGVVRLGLFLLRLPASPEEVAEDVLGGLAAVKVVLGRERVELGGDFVINGEGDPSQWALLG
jgi:hypothetical protein